MSAPPFLFRVDYRGFVPRGKMEMSFLWLGKCLPNNTNKGDNVGCGDDDEYYDRYGRYDREMEEYDEKVNDLTKYPTEMKVRGITNGVVVKVSYFDPENDEYKTYEVSCSHMGELHGILDGLFRVAFKNCNSIPRKRRKADQVSIANFLRKEIGDEELLTEAERAEAANAKVLEDMHERDKRKEREAEEEESDEPRKASTK